MGNKEREYYKALVSAILRKMGESPKLDSLFQGASDPNSFNFNDNRVVGLKMSSNKISKALIEYYF